MAARIGNIYIYGNIYINGANKLTYIVHLTYAKQ